MSLTVCPKCRHEFPPSSPPLSPASPPPAPSTTPAPLHCPCTAGTAPILGGAAPADWQPPGQPPGLAPPLASAPSPTPTSAMLSLSITASSATSLNGGHVLVNTTPSVPPSISVTATLPAMGPVWPWAAQPVAPATTSALPTWAMMPAPSQPLSLPLSLPAWAAPPAPPQPTTTWAVPASQPAPLTLGLGLFHGLARAPPRPPPIPKGAQYRLTGGGLVEERAVPPVLLQPQQHSPRGKPGPPSCASGPASGGVPGQSPSTPLSFVLPGGVALAGLSLDLLPLPVVPEAARPAAPADRLPLPQSLEGLQHPEGICGTPEADLRLLQDTTRALKASGWYYEGLSWQESSATLRHAAPGTFLVRDSSDPRFLFSLSVQTDRGPTSVRLLYIAGGFRLDAEPHLAPTMPLFPCVLRLVEHYMAHRGKRGSSVADQGCRNREQVWVDARGQMYSHILLTVPRRHSVPGLQHLARLAVHRQLKTASVRERCERVTRLELPTTLRRYLEEYPYTL